MKCNILHLCNFEATENIETNLTLISKEDAVIFYSFEMSKTNAVKLMTLFKEIKVYFVIKNNTDKITTISHDKWLYLVNQYNTTMTWK
jgi:hypothetical protein